MIASRDRCQLNIMLWYACIVNVNSVVRGRNIFGAIFSRRLSASCSAQDAIKILLCRLLDVNDNSPTALITVLVWFYVYLPRYKSGAVTFWTCIIYYYYYYTVWPQVWKMLCTQTRVALLSVEARKYSVSIIIYYNIAWYRVSVQINLRTTTVVVTDKHNNNNNNIHNTRKRLNQTAVRL